MMDPQRWRQIDALLLAALERNPAEWDGFLKEACRDDEALKREVRLLLSSGEQTSSLIDRPALESVAGLLSEHIPELIDGQAIGHYRIRSFIGSGGMGEVYLAEDTRLSRRVALKLLPSGCMIDWKHLYRFQQEARAASALNHPNIITIFEVGQFEGQHFIVSEFIEGETLRQRLKRERLSVGNVLDISIQIASALSVAHEAGIIHRDIKPENIMLRSDGYIKLLDFGLAKSSKPQERGEESVTTPGLLMGTVKYMSPEQARGYDVDTRSDIFSLGVVIYEMVAGRAPFEGATTSDLIASLLKDNPLALKHCAPGMPDELDRIINKALQKDPEGRYQDLQGMLDDLKWLKHQLELAYQPPGQPVAGGEATSAASNDQAATRTTDGMAMSTADAAGVHMSPARMHFIGQLKRRALTAAIVLLALLIAAAGIIYVSGRRDPRQRVPFQEMKITQIAGTQYSGYGVISPDGKYLAYVVEQRGQNSLWLRELATNEAAQVVAPAQVVYVGITFSPDSNRVFYVHGKSENAPALYEVPITGGESKKVLEDVAGPITFSPDGGRFAFVRRLADNETAIMLANADGSEERELARRNYPEFFNHAAPAWSPNGRVIACPAGNRANERYVNLVEVQVENGAVKPISSRRWASVEQVVWLSDGSGLIMIATEKQQEPYQIWSLSYPSGELRKVTNDLNGYARLSITADAKTAVTVRVQLRTSIWQVPGGGVSRAEQVTDESDRIIRDLCWSPDGRIVFPVTAGDGSEISVMKADGAGLKPLTADGYPKLWPSVSPDGRYIVFSSRGADTYHIWRMDADGGNVKQLTNGAGESAPSCSPDGWVVYASGFPDAPTLWKVPIGGGEPVQVSDKPSNFPKFSPDGKLIACWYKGEASADWKIAILATDGGRPVRILDMPLTPNMRWMPDGRALSYLVTRNGVSNLWVQPIDGGHRRQLTTFNSLVMYGFDWAREGTLICSRGFSVRDLVMITDSR